jgi:hypothetical protein
MVTTTERAVDRKRWWEIHDRETYVCPDCGRTQAEHGRPWEVHHLDGVAGDCVALCRTCHKVRHGARRRDLELGAWKDEFLALGTEQA